MPHSSWAKLRSSVHSVIHKDRDDPKAVLRLATVVDEALEADARRVRPRPAGVVRALCTISLARVAKTRPYPAPRAGRAQ